MKVSENLKTRPSASQLTWRMVALVAACALAALLVFWRFVPAGPSASESSDYQYFYAPVARNLVAGKGLITGEGAPAIHYPPGYPLLLAASFRLVGGLSGSEEAAYLGLTLISYLLGVVFLALLAQLHWGDRGALVAALAWISYPPILWLTKQPNSEIPFMAVLYASVYLLWSAFWRRASWPFYFLAGLLGGAAALIRPIGLGATVVMGIGLFVVARDRAWRLRTAMLGLVLLGTLTAIFPWQVWVYARTGRVVALSNNLVPSIRDGLRFAVNLKSYRQAVAVPDDVRAMMQRIDARYDEMTSLGRVGTVLAQEAQPMPLLKLLLIKMARSWYATDSGRREGLILAFQAIYLSLVLLGAFYAWRSGGPRRALVIGIGLTVFYFWGMTILTLSILRYLTPAIGLSFALLPSVLNRDRDKGSQPVEFG